MKPYQCLDPFDWQAILTLVQAEFAFMQGRIDPPSSMHQLTPDAIAAQAASGEVWAIGTPPAACVFLTPRPSALYVGKLAVATSHRHQGLARRLIDLAETRARALNLAALELQTRVELTENQAAFRALGFRETGRTAHAGFDRPTSVTFRRPVGSIHRQPD
jgi:ribosomal protein S18 acetylase RimI-like enzyme